MKSFELAERNFKHLIFQESGEYVPLIYEIEDYRNISTKIQSLKDIREDLSKTK